jgi:hypothetical protein
LRGYKIYPTAADLKELNAKMSRYYNESLQSPGKWKTFEEWNAAHCQTGSEGESADAVQCDNPKNTNSEIGKDVTMGPTNEETEKIKKQNEEMAVENKRLKTKLAQRTAVTFMQAVSHYMNDNNCSKADAVRACEQLYPDLHKNKLS